MAVGSFFYISLDCAVERLLESKDPLRVALGKKLTGLPEAMKAIEWADSDDSSPVEAENAIRAFLGKEADQLVLKVLIERAENAQKELTHAIEKVKGDSE